VTNYYDVLGLPRDASEAMIRDRFRVLAREHHPDRFTDEKKKSDAEVKFQLYTEAVNVLTNEQRRKAHDFELNRGSDSGNHDPQTVGKAYLAKGVKAYKESDFMQAIQLFDMAVKHYNKDPKSQHYLAMSCLKAPSPANVRKGIEAIEAAIKLEPHNGTLHRDACKLYKMAGMTAKAERKLEDALKWIPEDPETLRLQAELRPPPESKNILGNFFGRKG